MSQTMVSIGLTSQALKQSTLLMRPWLASTYALYLNTQSAHWNLVGPSFFSLHVLLQKHYEEMAEGIDEIAERIRTLGAPVEASFSAFDKHSLVATLKPNASWKAMLETLIEGHEAIVSFCREMIPKAQGFHDEATADLAIKRTAFHEKAAWLLRSHL